MKKCFFATVFSIVNLFFLHSINFDGENGEYSPYSYSPFPSGETNDLAFSPFSSEEKHSYPVDYDLISYDLYLDEEERQMIDYALPPGFEDSNALGRAIEVPVGNLLPLVLFSVIYICRIILKRKKK